MTNYVELSTWEAIYRPSTHDLPNILWNPKVNYCTHKSSQPNRMVSHHTIQLQGHDIRHRIPEFSRIALYVSSGTLISSTEYVLYFFS
jgi:hypothetical protein